MTDEHQTEANNPIAAIIDVRDPLEGLIEKTRTDPGATFQPAVLQRLIALKKDDRAAFEVLRAELKSAGCRMTALDEAIDEENGDTGGGRRPSQADVLIALAQSAELFHARTVPASLILTSVATVRLGRSAARVSAGGWHAAFTRRQEARRVRKLCNRH